MQSNLSGYSSPVLKSQLSNSSSLNKFYNPLKANDKPSDSLTLFSGGGKRYKSSKKEGFLSQLWSVLSGGMAKDVKEINSRTAKYNKRSKLVDVSNKKGEYLFSRSETDAERQKRHSKRRH